MITHKLIFLYSILLFMQNNNIDIGNHGSYEKELKEKLNRDAATHIDLTAYDLAANIEHIFSTNNYYGNESMGSIKILLSKFSCLISSMFFYISIFHNTETADQIIIEYSKMPHGDSQKNIEDLKNLILQIKEK